MPPLSCPSLPLPSPPTPQCPPLPSPHPRHCIPQVRPPASTQILSRRGLTSGMRPGPCAWTLPCATSHFLPNRGSGIPGEIMSNDNPARPLSLVVGWFGLGVGLVDGFWRVPARFMVRVVRGRFPLLLLLLLLDSTPPRAQTSLLPHIPSIEGCLQGQRQALAGGDQITLTARPPARAGAASQQSGDETEPDQIA